MAKNEKNSSKVAIGGVVFVGCMFIGIGLGIFFGNAGVGTLADRLRAGK